MLTKIQQILRDKNSFSHRNEGILIANVASAGDGVILATDMLTAVIDKKTLLLLSGGRTPKELYEALAATEKLEPGAVGLVDERYGEKFHENSNEKMIQDTGLLRYFSARDIPFYPILATGETREETADDYDLMLRELQTVYQKNVGILGIGLDGHTAGLPAQNEKRKSQIAKVYDEKYKLVTEYNDESGKYGKRVTMTFLGLSYLDLLLVLVFGDDKKAALDLVFSDGSEEEVPGRFYKRPEIAKKTLLITDQNI